MPTPDSGASRTSDGRLFFPTLPQVKGLLNISHVKLRNGNPSFPPTLSFPPPSVIPAVFSGNPRKRVAALDSRD